MKPADIISMQIGKNGLTQSFIGALKNAFNIHNNAKISVLKSATRNKEETEKIAQQLCTILGKKFTYKIIGYTISIKKWRKMPFYRRK
jgi:RNA-binding protein YhbY